MISDRDLSALEDILYSIKLLEKYSHDLSEDEFYQSQEKQDLIVHRLEIIGEASKRLSEKTINKYPEIPWKEMKGMRDVLIHQYDNIMLRTVWNVLNERIPEIKEKIVEAHEKES